MAKLKWKQIACENNKNTDIKNSINTSNETVQNKFRLVTILNQLRLLKKLDGTSQNDGLDLFIEVY